MARVIEIEDIEEMRRIQGIEDVELRLEIRDLKPGDFVKLTLFSGASNHVTALVRITSIRGSAFRGKLVKKAARMQAGDPIQFTTAHIHSVRKRLGAAC
jgi:hypothetical protein